MCKHNADHLNSTPTKVDYLVNSVKALLQTTLETVALLKKKEVNKSKDTWLRGITHKQAP